MGNRWRALGIALGVPLVLGALLCLLMRPRPAALVAPLLGPWAGLAFGHRDCTMATALPLPSYAVAGLGLLLLAAVMRVRHGAAHRTLPFAVGLWSLAWVGLMALSVANSLE